MRFRRLAEYFSELEKTTLRNTMVEILARLFKEATGDEIGYLCYLLQGRVAPLYSALELGMADKMVIRAISKGLSIPNETVVTEFKKEGDLGIVCEKLKGMDIASQPSLNFDPEKKGVQKNANISEIFNALKEIALSTGDGSQERKIDILGNLVKEMDGLSTRYIVRIPLGKLRLGFSDMTILDGLSYMETGDKRNKKAIERAYKVRPDLGSIAEKVKARGIKGLVNITPVPGTPIMMARANRLSSSEEILEKIGKCAVEYKYDGLRLQLHKDGNEVRMYSRNLEEMTLMFPEIKEAALKEISAENVILEGEVVAFNPETNVSVPFQETMQRKRKYDVEKKALEIPVKLFLFELLYLNGESYLDRKYVERKRELKGIIGKSRTLIYAQESIISEKVKMEERFQDAVGKHFEGIIAKKLDGRYEAGMRGWNWIKYKKAMNKKLADTVDALVMGYSLGEGKRTTFGVGQFLAGVYDDKRDVFTTISKIGTGLTDEQFKEFVRRITPYRTQEKPPIYEVDKLLTPDIWVKPELIVEIGCDEITRSAVHTSGRLMEPSKSGTSFSVKEAGFALRFPKLVRFRDDRRPEDATTVSEITKMYVKQIKR